MATGFANSAFVLSTSAANTHELARGTAHERSRHERWAECSRRSSWPMPVAAHKMHIHMRSVFFLRYLFQVMLDGKTKSLDSSALKNSISRPISIPCRILGRCGYVLIRVKCRNTSLILFMKNRKTVFLCRLLGIYKGISKWYIIVLFMLRF